MLRCCKRHSSSGTVPRVPMMTHRFQVGGSATAAQVSSAARDTVLAFWIQILVSLRYCSPSFSRRIVPRGTAMASRPTHQCSLLLTLRLTPTCWVLGREIRTPVASRKPVRHCILAAAPPRTCPLKRIALSERETGTSCLWCGNRVANCLVRIILVADLAL